jgi:hypothetical protein
MRKLVACHFDFRFCLALSGIFSDYILTALCDDTNVEMELISCVDNIAKAVPQRTYRGAGGEEV